MGLDQAGDRAGPNHHFHIYERGDCLAISVIECYEALLLYFGPAAYIYWVVWGRYIFYFGQTDCEFELVQSRHFGFDGCRG